MAGPGGNATKHLRVYFCHPLHTIPAGSFRSSHRAEHGLGTGRHQAFGLDLAFSRSCYRYCQQLTADHYHCCLYQSCLPDTDCLFPARGATTEKGQAQAIHGDGPGLSPCRCDPLPVRGPLSFFGAFLEDRRCLWASKALPEELKTRRPEEYTHIRPGDYIQGGPQMEAS